MNDQQATQFLADVRKPLLALHKTILEHERAGYEKEVGAVTPATFLQALINHPGFRWLGALSTVIANVDEMLDADEATPQERIGAAQGVIALFSQEQPGGEFLPRYRQLLQTSPDLLHEHGRVAQVLRQVSG